MKVDSEQYEFTLNDSYFEAIDAPEVQRGKVNVLLTVKKTVVSFELKFHTEGIVMVPCDRCLDDVEVTVSSDDRLIAKFGRTYSEEGDELVIVPEDEGELNVAWFMYEFIALAIPMKHVHKLGECNKEMARKLEHLQVGSVSDGEEKVGESDLDEADRPIDPRWNELKKIIDNN